MVLAWDGMADGMADVMGWHGMGWPMGLGWNGRWDGMGWDGIEVLVD